MSQIWGAGGEGRIVGALVTTMGPMFLGFTKNVENSII